MELSQPQMFTNTVEIDQDVTATLIEVRKQFVVGTRFTAQDFQRWIREVLNKEHNTWSIGRSLNRLNVDVSPTKSYNRAVYML